MTLAAGIDLGLSGALAVINCETRQLTHLWDMPTFQKKVGANMRPVIDVPRLREYLQCFADIGVQLVTIETPGYRKGQKGGGTVGFGAGLVVMGVVSTDPPIRYEMAAPNGWKSTMKVTSLKQSALRRAREVFPAQATWFSGPRGGELDGRAEAALICLYGVVRHLGIRQ